MKLFPRTHVISDASAQEYASRADALVSAVDKRMTLQAETSQLIGPNSLSVMYDNHQNHADLIVNVLKFRDYTLLEHILPWVISSYSSRGFSYAYFTEALTQWKAAVTRLLSPRAAEEIIPLYEWMETTVEQLHREFQAGTLEVTPIGDVMDEARKREVDEFVQLLISGKHIEAHRFMKLRISDTDSLMQCYENLLVPAMYQVGNLWESNKITVAHEHLATSIIMRIITYFYTDYVNTDQSKGKVVVTASANEYHEIGGRIVADFLELDGWDVSFLGANTPSRSVLDMLIQEHPDILAISVTMAYNFTKVQSLIQKIRSVPELDSMKIMIGGYAFTFSIDSAEQLGADELIMHAPGSIIKARQWWEEKQYA